MFHPRTPVGLCHLFASCLFCTIAGHSHATPVIWSGNGHSYEVIRPANRISWSDANTAAQNAGGYLATITSKAENDFVASLLTDPSLWFFLGGIQNGPWLGGFQQPGSSEPLGGWQWVTGEPWSFTAWAPTQPDNARGIEHFLGYWGSQIPSSTWNDYENGGTLELQDGLNAYIVERNQAVVPEPASLVVLLAGIAAAASRFGRFPRD